LLDRIRVASFKVCAGEPRTDGPEERRQSQTCRSRAVANAVRSLGSTYLTALAAAAAETATPEQ
jgi:hypothetical protein